LDTEIADGLLTVGADETAATLTVKATSTFDSTKSGTATVTVTVAPPAPLYSVAFDTADFAFDTVMEGYGAQTPFSASVTNTGNQATGDLDIALSGDNADAFEVSADALASIATGGKISFSVVPKPGLAPGFYYAVVTVSGGNGISADLTVSFLVNSAGGVVYSVLKHFDTFTGSGTSAAKVDADYTKFEQLEYKGAVIDPENYTLTPGSTIITLKESHLKTYANGTHVFTAVYTDGKSEDIQLLVKVAGASNQTQIPQTGDSGSLLSLTLAALASVLGALCLTASYRRRRETGTVGAHSQMRVIGGRISRTDR
jgi:LPXTG-motif cell wall-anchored protein